MMSPFDRVYLSLRPNWSMIKCSKITVSFKEKSRMEKSYGPHPPLRVTTVKNVTFGSARRTGGNFA